MFPRHLCLVSRQTKRTGYSLCLNKEPDAARTCTRRLWAMRRMCRHCDKREVASANFQYRAPQNSCAYCGRKFRNLAHLVCIAIIQCLDVVSEFPPAHSLRSIQNAYIAPFSLPRHTRRARTSTLDICTGPRAPI